VLECWDERWVALLDTARRAEGGIGGTIESFTVVVVVVILVERRNEGWIVMTRNSL